MRNPRPCWVCRSPKSEHDDPEAYKPSPRTEPLRARRDAWTLGRMHYIAVSALREFIETEARALAECDYGVFNQGRLLQLDRIRERFCD